MKKILVFSPFAGIWTHANLEHQLMNQFPNDEFSVQYVRCRNLFQSHCTVMESFRMPLDASKERRESICKRCRGAASDISETRSKNRKSSAPDIYIDDFISETEKLRAVKDVEGLHQTTDILDFSPLNAITLEDSSFVAYEALLKFKKVSLDFTADEIPYLRNSLSNSYLCAIAAQNLFKEVNADILFIYSPQYAINNAFAFVAKQNGLSTYFIEGSSNQSESGSSIRIWNWDRHKLVNPAVMSWQHRGLFCRSSEDEARTARHFESIESGASFSYSSKNKLSSNFRTNFGIPNEHKVWLMALSSFDEAYAAFAIGAFPDEKFKSAVFSDQFEWVKETILWFKSQAPKQTSLVIRMHPRDFPNYREKYQSEQAQIWEKILHNLPANTYIDHPRDNIPIKGYFPDIAALLTGWSSTAIDAMLNGVPVVTYDANLPSFPKDIHISGFTRHAYFENLKSLSTTRDSDFIAEAAQDWLAFNYSLGTVRLTGRLQDRSNLQNLRVANRVLRLVAHFFPKIIRKIDLRQNVAQSPDHDRLMELVRNSLPNLYSSINK
jgi:hypothetical protein